MNSHNSMYEHIKSKFIQSIRRLISSPEITPITTPTVSFNTGMCVLISCDRGDPGTGYQSYIIQGTFNMQSW